MAEDTFTYTVDSALAHAAQHSDTWSVFRDPTAAPGDLPIQPSMPLRHVCPGDHADCERRERQLAYRDHMNRERT